MDLNENDVRELVELIRKIVQQEIRKIKNIEYTYFGSIKKSVGNNLWDVEIPSTGILYEQVPNKSGQTLEIGNSVIIKMDGNSSNAYIAVKNG